MCGISFIFSREKRDVGRQVKMMMSMIQHRGPDSSFYEIFDSSGNRKNQSSEVGNIAIGCNRLAIVDDKDESNQPMQYLDGRYWITFNGEIYNHNHLKIFCKKQDTYSAVALIQK